MKYSIVNKQLRVPRDNAYGTYPKTHISKEGGSYTSFVNFYLYAISYLPFQRWGWERGFEVIFYSYFTLYLLV
jgi:hypothetical protein